MSNDQKLEEQIGELVKLGKENKKVDVAALMLNALQADDTHRVSAKSRRVAYLASLAAPPFGLLFALKFYLSSEDDARQVANVCVALTVVSVAALWIFGKVLLSGAGVSTGQLQQIQPSDVMELTQ